MLVRGANEPRAFFNAGIENIEARSRRPERLVHYHVAASETVEEMAQYIHAQLAASALPSYARKRRQPWQTRRDAAQRL